MKSLNESVIVIILMHYEGSFRDETYFSGPPARAGKAMIEAMQQAKEDTSVYSLHCQEVFLSPVGKSGKSATLPIRDLSTLL
jgi:hypothetical protein